MRQERKWFPVYIDAMDTITQETGIKLFLEKRYTEAAEAFRQFLAQPLSAGLEADTRRRLADTLASLGQAEEAAAERELAGNIAESSTGDPMALMTKGDLLKRDHHYDEACATYEQALRLVPPQPSPGRALLMAKLALAHYDASRPAKTIIWAGASLANKPSAAIRLIMHRMAGVGYSAIGDLEQAERHYTEALKLAEIGGKPEEISQSLTTLATIQQKRGRFEEAIFAARRAVQTFAHPGRGAVLVEVECLRDMGRLEEASTLVNTMKQGPRYDRPDMEQRTQVICSLTLAWIEANADRPAAALVALQEAWANLGVSRDVFPLPPPKPGGEDKLVLYCDSTAVRVYAQLGQLENARHMQESVEARMESFAQDRASLLGVYSELAPAAFALGDYDACRNWWQKYLNSQPDVVGRVKAHYGLGEAFLKQGETKSALDAYTQAVTPRIDSLNARRAQARLEEMGG
jgi:tetratricopeptide (TPR) repeat protein